MKRTLQILALAVAAVVIALFVFLLSFDLNEYKDDVISTVENNTGRDFRIDGDLRLGISLVPTVVIEKASLANAAWGTQPSMVDIERLEVAVAILPLLRGDIQVNRFDLVRPDIYLETDARGKGNWILKPKKKQEQEAPGKEAPADGAGAPRLGFKRILIEEARIRFRDGRSEAVRDLAIDRIELRAGGLGAPMQLNLEAEYNELSLRLEGRTGSLDALLANESMPVNLDAGLNDLQLHLEGSIAEPLSANGLALALRLEADSLRALPGTGLPDTGPLSVTASLEGGKGVYNLEPVEARLGKSDLSGKIGIDTNKTRPVLAVQLQSQQIDLTPFEPEPERRAAPAGERVFSDAPLPVASLRSMDAGVSLAVAKLQSRRLPMQSVNLKMKLENGSLRMAPLTAQVAGGKLRADTRLAARGEDNVKLNLELDIRDLQPGLLPQFRKKNTIKAAPTGVQIKAGGSGNSVRAIMAGLNGSLLVKVGEGEIRNSSLEMAGADLLTKTFSMLMPSDDKEKVTELQCAVVNFTVKDGIAVSDNGIAMETPRMTVVGGGAINLKTEELDLGMRPHAREGLGIGAGQLAELVRLRGTLANPETKPDTVAAMKTAATIGAAVATGGLSLLAGGLLDKATADEHPCQTALGGAPVESRRSPPPDSGATDSGEKESVGDKVKGMFKGLFGD